MDKVGVIALLGMVALVGVFIGWRQWQKARARDAKHWPKTIATIESGGIEQLYRGKFASLRLPVFAFSYKANEDYYSGRFSLLPYITNPGSSIVERMIGRTLDISYAPQRPERWFVLDEFIEGCRVEQKTESHMMPLYPSD